MSLRRALWLLLRGPAEFAALVFLLFVFLVA